MFKLPSIRCALGRHRWRVTTWSAHCRLCHRCGRLQTRGLIGRFELAAWLAGWRP